ncbi:MAG TPA: hypothetical protein VG838_07170 [Opitutaceae bacterium]|nr:hypothetical protein [Opitutaceae bacterium]
MLGSFFFLCATAGRLSAKPSFTGLGNPLGGDGTRAVALAAGRPLVVGISLDHTSMFTAQRSFRWSPQDGATDLGQLPGAAVTLADRISPTGSVITGTSETRQGRGYSEQAFRWTREEGIVAIPLPPGTATGNSILALSDDGAVLTGIADSVAFCWTRAGGSQSLGVVAGEIYSIATGISADGRIIVGQSGRAGTIEAFRWTQEEGMRGIGFLPGSNENDEVFISADGNVIVGTAFFDQLTPQQTGQVFRWTARTGMVALPFPPGQGYGEAHAVSADGITIVGEGRLSGSTTVRQAFRWTLEGGMEDLGFLPGGGDLSLATGVSADGSKVVGHSDSIDGVVQMFLWTERDGIRSVRDVLVEDYGLKLDGWTLVSGMISADGRSLAGNGINPAGQDEAWFAHLGD